MPQIAGSVDTPLPAHAATLAQSILAGRFVPGDTVEVQVRGGQLAFERGRREGD